MASCSPPRLRACVLTAHTIRAQPIANDSSSCIVPPTTIRHNRTVTAASRPCPLHPDSPILTHSRTPPNTPKSFQSSVQHTSPLRPHSWDVASTHCISPSPCRPFPFPDVPTRVPRHHHAFAPPTGLHAFAPAASIPATLDRGTGYAAPHTHAHTPPCMRTCMHLSHQQNPLHGEASSSHVARWRGAVCGAHVQERQGGAGLAAAVRRGHREDHGLWRRDAHAAQQEPPEQHVRRHALLHRARGLAAAPAAPGERRLLVRGHHVGAHDWHRRLHCQVGAPHFYAFSFYHICMYICMYVYIFSYFHYVLPPPPTRPFKHGDVAALPKRAHVPNAADQERRTAASASRLLNAAPPPATGCGTRSGACMRLHEHSVCLDTDCPLGCWWW